MSARDDSFHERFERTFRSRVPPEVARSFTADQMAAIKSAFGGERWDGHAVDIRGTVPLPFKRYYFVLVAGPDRRGRRRARPLRRPPLLRRAVGATLSTVALVWLAILALYTFLPPGLLPAL